MPFTIHQAPTTPPSVNVGAGDVAFFPNTADNDLLWYKTTSGSGRVGDFFDRRKRFANPDGISSNDVGKLAMLHPTEPGAAAIYAWETVPGVKATSTQFDLTEWSASSPTNKLEIFDEEAQTTTTITAGTEVAANTDLGQAVADIVAWIEANTGFAAAEALPGGNTFPVLEHPTPNQDGDNSTIKFFADEDELNSESFTGGDGTFDAPLPLLLGVIDEIAATGEVLVRFDQLEQVKAAEAISKSDVLVPATDGDGAIVRFVSLIDDLVDRSGMTPRDAEHLGIARQDAVVGELVYFRAWQEPDPNSTF